MTKATTAQRLLEERLGTPLADHVATERAAGKSWQDIRDDLLGRTDVRVSAQSLRNWFGSVETVGAA